MNQSLLKTGYWKGLFFLLLVLSLSTTLASAGSQITERIEWRKTPIKLKLKVGQERMVTFPDSVKVGVPSQLQPMLRTQNINGTVYLMAQAAFDSTRIMVREIEGDQIYLLDISASEESVQNNPVEIYAQEEDASSNAEFSIERNRNRPKHSYVSLIRFAAQQLYAPARLLRNRPGIVRTPVARTSIPLLRGGAIDARPLVAWRAGGYYLTAVRLTNQTAQAQTLDPRDLRGNWLTASFQHHRLLPAGNEADTTAVYLISARPFAVSY
ncbi:MAG TPA: TIGR03749 family integrating conjugative element protein [Gammaproteobacteria bacterium]|nr:TIGR03749 family integrating conjugative element protein [Gammaproteobacteria bacterium]